MIGEIWKVAKTIVQLADDLQKYRAEIKEVRQDVLNITLLLQRLNDEIEMLKRREVDQRENTELRLKVLQLELENKLLSKSAREDEEEK